MTTPEASTAHTRTADPFPRSWQRLAALSGILFAILLILTIAVGGAETPDYDDPVGKWTGYATDNQDNLRLSALISGLALVEFLWYIGYLRSVLGAGERAVRGFARLANIAYAGGIVGIAGLVLGSFIAAASVSHPDADPGVMRTVNDISGAGFEVGLLGFSVMLTASGFVILRTDVLPRWTGFLGLAGGTFALLTLGVLLSEKMDNFFGIFYPLAFLSLVIFTIATSVSFVRRLATTV